MAQGKNLAIGSGAAQGAALGTAVFPGIGTAVGAAAGGIAAALGFGSSKKKNTTSQTSITDLANQNAALAANLNGLMGAYQSQALQTSSIQAAVSESGNTNIVLAGGGLLVLVILFVTMKR